MNPIKPSRRSKTSKAAAPAPGTLYLVATPIGNLGDITHRALEVLEAADVLLAEDTRRTRKLLTHFGIAARSVSFHDHNEEDKLARVLERLRRGERVALVSDAGTPLISDPGYRLVRAAAAAGVDVVPIPGPSAPIAALTASGLPTAPFSFAGYPPRKAGERKRFFEAWRDVPGTLVLLESPRRLRSTLQTAVKVLGASRPAVVAREMTKRHEQFLRGTLAHLLAALGDSEVRGEITVCIGASLPEQRVIVTLERPQVVARYEALLAAGIERREAMRCLAHETGLHRRDIYRALIEPAAPTTDEEDST